MKKVALLITVLLLIVLYAQIDTQALLWYLRTMHRGVFLLALVCVVPQVFVTALRWSWMVRDVYPMRLFASTRLILAGKALNALLPSKLGETSKAYFLKTHADVALPYGVALVLLEKVLDVAGLCAILLVGMLLTPHLGAVETSATLIALLVLAVVAGICTCRVARVQRWLQGRLGLGNRLGALLESWDTILEHWRQEPARLFGILLLSWGLWGLHLLQIGLFFVALRSQVEATAIIAYVPISIFIGLLPITIGGVGTRDAALIHLFAPYASPAMMAGIGLLCSLRYVLDSLIGLPFFRAYLSAKG
jgi:hypothetical protein